MMTPALRKFALTAHVTSSVGWLGAVAWCVIVPLSLVSPLTGIVQSLGTSWGLFRRYWIVVKLIITIPATILLLLHMKPIGHLARVVAETTQASGELSGQRIQLVNNAGAAVVVLLAATALSVTNQWE